jgi:hypothetical protein
MIGNRHVTLGASVTPKPGRESVARLDVEKRELESERPKLETNCEAESWKTCPILTW